VTSREISIQEVSNSFVIAGRRFLARTPLFYYSDILRSFEEEAQTREFLATRI
jgi:hypothetical protein